MKGDKSKTLGEILPENRTMGLMPDRIWETYDCQTGICNSLNAYTGYVRLGGKLDPICANQLEKAQAAIVALLEETGRMDEFRKWAGENSRTEQHP